MLFPGSEDVPVTKSAKAAKPQPSAETAAMVEPQAPALPEVEIVAEGAEAPEAQEAVPQPAQAPLAAVPDEVAQMRNQLAQAQAVIQQQQQYLQYVAGQMQRPPQIQQQALAQEEPMTADAFYQDPEKAAERVATRVMERAVQERVLPMAQQLTNVFQQQVAASVAGEYNGIIGDAKLQPFVAVHRQEFDAILRSTPIEYLARPGAVREIFNYVRARHLDDAPIAPQQPAIAQNIPYVATKSLAPQGKSSSTKKVRLSEDEAAMARKQGLTPEEYAHYKDNPYG